MIQEEIQECEEQIALMLGAIYSPHAQAWGFGNARIEPNEIKFNGKTITGAVWAQRFEKELKFHSDWNWIMEAVEFIKKTSGISIVQGSVKQPTCVIHLSNLRAISGQAYTLKEAVFIAVSDFAKLYNSKQL